MNLEECRVDNAAGLVRCVHAFCPCADTNNQGSPIAVEKK